MVDELDNQIQYIQNKNQHVSITITLPSIRTISVLVPHINENQEFDLISSPILPQKN
jgi:hypothetical protein